MFTAQEVFDKVVSHLRSQGGPAVNEEGTCMYRAPGGKKCAVGCMIPDDVYSKNMECRLVSSIIDAYSALSDLQDHVVLLEELQEIHDQVDPSEWEIAFEAMTASHGLIYTPMKNNGCGAASAA